MLIEERFQIFFWFLFYSIFAFDSKFGSQFLFPCNFYLLNRLYLLFDSMNLFSNIFHILYCCSFIIPQLFMHIPYYDPIILILFLYSVYNILFYLFEFSNLCLNWKFPIIDSFNFFLNLFISFTSFCLQPLKSTFIILPFLYNLLII